MAYCTLQDLVDRFGVEEILDVADRDKDGTPDEVVVSAACEDASAEIDARLAKRYRVPFSTSTRLLRALCCDIARYRLLDDRPHEQASTRYEAAIALLDSIAAGDVTLGSEEQTIQADQAASTSIRLMPGRSCFDLRDQGDFSGGLR